MKSLLPKFSLKTSCQIFLVFTVLSGSFFAVTPAFAATGVNKQINFQGKLVDSSGLNVADGSYTVVFTLYDASSGGTNLWTESDSVTTTAGIFQVSLGAVNTALGAVNFNSDTIYLGIKVGADAEMTPRIRFTAVPYALNADRLDGVVATQSATGFNLTGGTSTLKTLTVNDSTQLNTSGLTFANGKSTVFSNSLTFAGTDSTTITFQGSDTYVGRTTNDILTNKTIGSTGLTFSGASTDITTGTNEDLTIAPNGTGKIGINAATPLAAIDLRGNSGTLAVASVSGNTSFAALLVDNNGLGDLFDASKSGATKFRIANNGDVVLTAGINVGGSVGTGSQCLLGGATASWGSCSSIPNYLRLSAGAFSLVNDTQDFLFGNVATGSALFKLSPSGTSPVASVSANTSYAGMVVDNKGTGDLFTASSSGLTRFVIKQNGNVGIGTANPTSLLTLQGPQGNYLITMTDGSATSGMFVDHSLNAAMQWGTVTNNAMGFFTNDGTTQMALNTNGGTTIGTYANSGTYTVGPANGLAVSGNVGIGTASPLASLDVRGTSGTTPVASFSGVTAQAALVVDNSGVGDLFTASKSGLTKFAIKNSGDVEVGNANSASQLTVTGASGYGVVLGLGASGGNTIDGALNGVANQSLWLNPTSMSDVLIVANGGNTLIGTSADTAQNNKLVVKAADTQIGIVNSSNNNWGLTNWNGTNGLYFQYNGLNRMFLSSTGSLQLTSGLGGSAYAPLATLDVRANSGTTPVASFSGSTTNAALIVDNSGNGNIFTASSAGETRFRMANNGSVLFEGDIISSIGTLNGAGSASQTNDNAVINATGDQGSLIPNSGFESNLTSVKTGNTADPVISDGWISAATASANVVRISTDSAKGTSSMMVKLNANQNSAFYSTCVPIALATGLGSYNLNWYAKSTSAATVVRGYIDGYANKANCQSDTSRTVSAALDTTALVANTWKTKTGTVAAGLGTITWARAHIFVGCAAGCATATLTEIDGVRLIESALTGGVDYAEQYPADPNNMPEAGDVVSIVASGSASIVKKADHYMDPSTIGVVSTNPGEVLDDGTLGDAKVPVALAGRIPTNVSTKNGPIHVGDYLTASDIPGVAVKAISAGQVIGQAMEEDTDTDPSNVAQVVMFVKNTYFNGIPLNYASGLTEDHAQGDLEFLGQLVSAAQTTASTNNTLNTISADRVVAGLSIIAPKVTTDVLGVNTIKSASQSGIAVQLDNGKELQIGNASGSAGIRFDGQGNAFFAGTITADKIKVNGLEILQSTLQTQATQIASLSAIVASSSPVLPTVPVTPPPSMMDKEASMAAFLAKYDTNILTIQALSIEHDATVSGSLRIKGDSLVEGVMHVVDTLTTGNLLVNQAADFFGKTIFHGDVLFSSAPTFSDDTAGYTIIQKGSKKIEVTFKKEYVTQPIISATLVSTRLTDETFKADKANGLCNEHDDMQTCQDKADKEILADSIKYVVTNRSTKGFTIVLEDDAKDDTTFSWMALAVGE